MRFGYPCGHADRVRIACSCSICKYLIDFYGNDKYRFQIERDYARDYECDGRSQSAGITGGGGLRAFIGILLPFCGDRFPDSDGSGRSRAGSDVCR